MEPGSYWPVAVRARKPAKTQVCRGLLVVLVAWNFGVDGAGPGVDASGERLGVGEALIA